MKYKCYDLRTNAVKVSDELVFNINLNSGWCVGQVEFDDSVRPVEEFKVTFTKRENTGTNTAG